MLLAHHLLAHGWALGRDVDRLLATRAAGRRVAARRRRARRARRCRSTRRVTAEVLGFAAAFDNSLDAVSDRDFVAEALFDLALLGVHLSRIGEEVVLWSTEEFGFAAPRRRLRHRSARCCPQKKNPDIAELARGKAGRLIGNLTGLLATLKGLPLAYNRDLQEDKEPLFDAVDQVLLALAALTGLLDDAPTFDPERMQRPPPTCPTARPPIWPSTSSSGHAVPRRPRHRRRPRARRRSSAGCRWPSSSQPTPPRRRGRRAARAGRRGHAGARPAAAPARRRWPRSWPASESTCVEGPAAHLMPTAWPHRAQVRVRYGEVDMQRVVFNAHYLAYIDDTMESWLYAVLDATSTTTSTGIHGHGSSSSGTVRPPSAR